MNVVHVSNFFKRQKMLGFNYFTLELDAILLIWHQLYIKQNLLLFSSKMNEHNMNKTPRMIQGPPMQIKKPFTSYCQKRQLPDIAARLQNHHFRMSESQENFFKMEDQPTINYVIRKLSRKPSIKQKLFQLKKRTVSKCELGIGYDSGVNEIQAQKLAQDFFPQRALSLFKKIAFKNSASNLWSNDKVNPSQKNSQNQKKGKKQVQLKITRPKIVTEQKPNRPDIQIKIKSIECAHKQNIPNIPMQLCFLNLTKHSKKPSESKIQANAPQLKQKINNDNTIQSLGPWDFIETEQKSIDEDGNCNFNGKLDFTVAKIR